MIQRYLERRITRTCGDSARQSTEMERDDRGEWVKFDDVDKFVSQLTALATMSTEAPKNKLFTVMLNLHKLVGKFPVEVTREEEQDE